MNDEAGEVFVTVGELARRVGVTVRTIQYYDQQGLLSPSAKGPQNQRLYTEDNVQDLYRILTLKYMGLSLTEIKEQDSCYEDGTALKELANKEMDAIEDGFQQLFKRLTTLRALQEQVSSGGAAWSDLAQTIERCQDESQFFWRLTAVGDASLDEDAVLDQTGREESIARWHELIADALRLIQEHEPIESKRSHDLARRYYELGAQTKVDSSEQNIIMMENMTPHHGSAGSFEELREQVFSHLRAVAAFHGDVFDVVQEPDVGQKEEIAQ